METQLEPAIPPHFQVPRVQPARTPDEYVPPYPAYCARFPKSIKGLVMAIVGVQSRRDETLEPKNLDPILGFIKDKNAGAAKPSFWDIASVRDNSKAHNLTVIAYWPGRASYEEWVSSSGFGSWWEQLQPDKEPRGWFREVFFPPIDSFETVFSDNSVPEGAARMREGISGPVREHVYLGSMRDRMPISQTDPLNGDEWSAKGFAASGQSKPEESRIKVPGRRNVCVIRSGQDWSATTPHERTKYLETMHPVLVRGMDFLRDQGSEVGCFECRFMSVHDEGQSLDKSTDRTFGLAFFNDMAALEKWSREHKTHLDIFGRFLQYAQELENNVSLRLFHEVLVLQPDQQLFEYVGCHAGTGMLSSAQ